MASGVVWARVASFGSRELRTTPNFSFGWRGGSVNKVDGGGGTASSDS